MRALRLHPFLGALPWPQEGVISKRLGQAYEQALRAQEEALRAQTESMLAHVETDALLDQHAALSAQAEALASLKASTAPALAALDSNMASASAALAALSETTTPAIADLGATIAALTPQASTTEQSVSISHHQDDSSGNWIWSNNGEKLSVSYSGRFDFTDDDTDLREISSDGYLKISDAAWIGRHTVEIQERGGQLEHRYFVNGSERSYEPEGRQWLRENLPKFVRNTGIGAERRVARYLKSGGPSAVLAEIARIDSSYVKRIYFTELLEQATLNADQYRAVPITSSRRCSSRLPTRFRPTSRRARRTSPPPRVSRPTTSSAACIPKCSTRGRSPPRSSSRFSRARARLNQITNWPSCCGRFSDSSRWTIEPGRCTSRR